MDQILKYIAKYSSMVEGMFLLKNRSRKTVTMTELYLGFSAGKCWDSTLN
jgi:hypothetical protein